MDNLAHSLVGLTSAKAGLERLSPHATTICVISANAADADFLSLLFGDRWTYIEITGFTFVYLALMVRAEQIEDSQPEPETEQVAGEEPLLGALPAAAAAQ